MYVEQEPSHRCVVGDLGWGVRGRREILGRGGAVALVKVRPNAYWVQGAGSGGAEMWSGSGSMLKVEPTGLVEGLPRHMGDRGVKDSPRPSGLSNKRMELLFTEMGGIGW